MASGTVPQSGAATTWLGTLWGYNCHHLAGHFGALKLSHADYTQVLYVPIHLAKNKSMIAVTGVERFHFEEENTYEGNALGYLDCQGGLSVPETRLELAYASSENPQNTLAKSKARRVCA